ncbi:unnamed protein product [Rotaria sordida]|uniref:Reverse transcriptase domain-containing protein n=1 Tax=Rotaria sordida TaxID=392033 RepID=A0A819WWJ2_9BILA|nr:unnamed protein product [Rotaria sordida]CAF3838149.1 unnamed protein product [Rotaria sordida]CAF4131583.1 unnamed protein product [Rotaria sordida]
MFPAAPTSRRSDAIIDFAITQDKIGWTCEVIDEGTSDHFPVIFSAPFTLSEKVYLLIGTRRGLNVWKFARPFFHSYTPPFRGLTIDNEVERDTQKICDQLGNYFEQHFSPPIPDYVNKTHEHSLIVYESIAYLPNMPLNMISYAQVYKNWKKFSPKKSLDSSKTSAYLLKKLPVEYMNVFTVLFNKCASKGNVFEESAPQGSVLSATLFRLHIHFLPKTLARFCSHLFADDLALIIKGSIEKKFTQNIEDIEQQASIAMKLLENFSKNLILPFLRLNI